MRKRTVQLAALAFVTALWAHGVHGEEPHLLGSSHGPELLRVDVHEVILEGATGLRTSLAIPAGVKVRDFTTLGPGSWALAGIQGKELYLASGIGNSSATMNPPGHRQGRFRRAPLLLGGDATLSGVAWLEGDSASAMEVRAALGHGEPWRVETVASRAPGSQTGLAGAVLSDGSLLLCWSRNDGIDDDIVCSRRSGEEWGPPVRLAPDNDVPDITPSVMAVPGGALVSWSRYDGHEYRLVISRLTGQEWSPPKWVAGKGSLYPSFSVLDGELLLTFRNARAQGWGVLHLDGEGTVLRTVTLDGHPLDRPVPLAVDGDEITLTWARKETTTSGWNHLP